VTDLLAQSGVDQLALLCQGNITALELAEQHILRIEQLNPQINAIVDFDADRVRQQACTVLIITGITLLLVLKFLPSGIDSIHERRAADRCPFSIEANPD
jgi:Asp-tRNA(Asn)/Glu-tRNA(Gln) amidotransferase A subunit family amidase